MSPGSAAATSPSVQAAAGEPLFPGLPARASVRDPPVAPATQVAAALDYPPDSFFFFYLLLAVIQGISPMTLLLVRPFPISP